MAVTSTLGHPPCRESGPSPTTMIAPDAAAPGRAVPGAREDELALFLHGAAPGGIVDEACLPEAERGPRRGRALEAVTKAMTLRRGP